MERQNSRGRGIGAQSGFTLIEMTMVVVLVGILSAIALPRYDDLTMSARVAALTQLAGSLQAAANNVRMYCLASSATSGCSVTAGSWSGQINGQNFQLSMGYPDAGDSLNNNEIDTALTYSGFTPQLTSWSTTTFLLNSAPTPQNCSVAYGQANYFGSWTPIITMTTSGC